MQVRDAEMSSFSGSGFLLLDFHTIHGGFSSLPNQIGCFRRFGTLLNFSGPSCEAMCFTKFTVLVFVLISPGSNCEKH